MKFKKDEIVRAYFGTRMYLLGRLMIKEEYRQWSYELVRKYFIKAIIMTPRGVEKRRTFHVHFDLLAKVTDGEKKRYEEKENKYESSLVANKI